MNVVVHRKIFIGLHLYEINMLVPFLDRQELRVRKQTQTSK